MPSLMQCGVLSWTNLEPYTDMNYLSHPKEKAILYKIQNEWVLELICDLSFSYSKGFATAKQAREFARAKRISVKRAANCDS